MTALFIIAGAIGSLAGIALVFVVPLDDGET